MNLEVHKQQEHEVSKTQMEVVEKKKNEYKIVGQMRNRPGLILWQYNLVNGELQEVEIGERKAVIDIKKKVIFHSKVKITSADNIYIWALNRKNAEKKVNKLFKDNCYEIR